jgi:hypothetical protein
VVLEPISMNKAKIKMLTSVSTVDHSFGGGQEVEVSEIQARQWVKAGQAQWIGSAPPEPKPAAAPAPAAETDGTEAEQPPMIEKGKGKNKK